MMTDGKPRLEEARHRGLGRGLSALIGDEAAVGSRTEGGRKPNVLPTGYLRPSNVQPRQHFAEDELRELAESIREKGILQPIVVRPRQSDPTTYEIIAGERRWRAAQLAQLHEVPVVVREVNDSEALQLAIIENVQRADLNAIEEAAAYHELMTRFEFTQERVSKVVGKSRSHVANTLRLLNLPAAVVDHVRAGRLTAGHARALLGTADPEARAREIIAGEMSVRQTEQRSSQGKQKLRHAAKTTDPNIKATEASLSKWLGLNVQIVHKGEKGGDLRISYKTLEQLDDLIHRLRTGGQTLPVYDIPTH